MSTFAERKAARLGEKPEPQVEPKQVDESAEEVEDKAVKAASAKRRRS